MPRVRLSATSSAPMARQKCPAAYRPATQAALRVVPMNASR
ncbi:hypothetical protein HMPREF0762_01083 [Slackia exigua ATCC 700122]|uniref:Uncharacterized protein n=1 Tax=Slackia exigua (strain ATCC 700122 / DSM 15923 / CIP 105133 / JCM 11022 / KCTC 5966 / S-7) TaxID=649764 RepID=D0WGX8_SLAES|nr:hypothetical protein HMPREF0762_01083 [Slackia exigua ATCC 700122]